VRQASSPVCRAASIQQYFNHLKPGETLRSPISQAPLHSRNLVPCQNVKTMVTEHKERAKRPRPQASPEELLMEALLPPPVPSKAQRVGGLGASRKFGVERTNSEEF
jgi:hypothetical protein